jgi:acyl-CoA synthetase (AMP-forming)/AMP-acid ligase II
MRAFSTTGTTGIPKIVPIPDDIMAAREQILIGALAKTGFGAVRTLFIDYARDSILGVRFADIAAKTDHLRVLFPSQGTIEGTLKQFDDENVDGIVSTPSGLYNYAKAAGQNSHKFAWMLSASSRLLKTVAAEVVTNLGPNLWSLYACTEGGHIALASVEQINATDDCVGTVIDGVQVAIDHGEIKIKGPGTISGYPDNPELTAEKFKDGWYFTGDLGRLDGNILYLTGRKPS